MGYIETLIQSNHHSYIIIWLRFLDDIFFIWTGTPTALHEFINHMNNIHPKIKFTTTISTSTVNFLDTTIYLDTERYLQSTLYRKPTDKNLILDFESYHPLHTKTGIIYSQALRYSLICSKDSDLENELTKLKRILLARNYPNQLIDDNFHKALLIPRQTLLNNRTRHPTKDILPFITPFHPLSKLHTTYTKHLYEHYFKSKNSENTTLPPNLTTCYTKHKTIKDLLIRAHLPRSVNLTPDT